MENKDIPYFFNTVTQVSEWKHPNLKIVLREIKDTKKHLTATGRAMPARDVVVKDEISLRKSNDDTGKASIQHDKAKVKVPEIVIEEFDDFQPVTKAPKDVFSTVSTRKDGRDVRDKGVVISDGRNRTHQQPVDLSLPSTIHDVTLRSSPELIKRDISSNRDTGDVLPRTSVNKVDNRPHQQGN